jgi:hypothetical protein
MPEQNNNLPAPKRSPFTPEARQPSAGNFNGKPKAEAFINCFVTNAAGDQVKISKGIAIDSTTLVGRSIIAQAQELAAEGKDLVISLEGTIKLVVDDSNAELMKF